VLLFSNRGRLSVRLMQKAAVIVMHCNVVVSIKAGKHVLFSDAGRRGVPDRKEEHTGTLSICRHFGISNGRSTEAIAVTHTHSQTRIFQF
jgi:hypothetical protein